MNVWGIDWSLSTGVALAWRDVAGTVTVWEMNGTVVTRRVVLGGDGQTTLLRRPGRRAT